MHPVAASSHIKTFERFYVGEDVKKQEYFMKQALLMVSLLKARSKKFQTNTENQGEKALAAGETPVGCVLVYQEKIIGSGMNDTNRSMNVRQYLFKWLSCITVAEHLCILTT